MAPEGGNPGPFHIRKEQQIIAYRLSLASFIGAFFVSHSRHALRALSAAFA